MAGDARRAASRGRYNPRAAGQSAVLGLARTIALEYPELHCRRIDLNPHPAQDEIENLVNEILRADEREEEIAFRGTRRVRRLVRAETGAALPCRCGTMPVISSQAVCAGLACS